MVTAPLAPPEMVNATTRMRTADVEFETRSPVLRAVPISTLSRETEFESQPAHSFVVAAAICLLIFVSQVQRKDNNNDNEKHQLQKMFFSLVAVFRRSVFSLSRSPTQLKPVPLSEV